MWPIHSANQPHAHRDMTNGYATHVLSITDKMHVLSITDMYDTMHVLSITDISDTMHVLSITDISDMMHVLNITDTSDMVHVLSITDISNTMHVLSITDISDTMCKVTYTLYSFYVCFQYLLFMFLKIRFNLCSSVCGLRHHFVIPCNTKCESMQSCGMGRKNSGSSCESAVCRHLRTLGTWF
jgi:hypothetical protein